jgi:RHS repeat-associated protein
VEDFIWRDGLLLGSQRPLEMGGRRHFHLDHLGSPRLITSDNGQMVSYHDYYPFGDEKSSIWQEGPSAGGFDREEPMKFTGHERDYAGGMGAEDGHALDYMHARYASPTMGRFLSVDPSRDFKLALRVPQAWNRYTYALNNPLGYADPTGRDVSISITFKGDGWTDDMKKAVIADVTKFYTALDVGKVFVFDSAKASHSSLFAFDMRGYASITADSGATGGMHSPDLVRAGAFLQDKSLNDAQKANAIANTVDHETLAHHFYATYDNFLDVAHYDRSLHFADQFPELRQYFGTVADSHIVNDPQYAGRLFSGPLPVNPRDKADAQLKLRPHEIGPPD